MTPSLPTEGGGLQLTLHTAWTSHSGSLNRVQSSHLPVAGPHLPPVGVLHSDALVAPE